MRIKITKKGFLLLLLLPLPRFLRLLRDRHCEDCAPSSKSVNSHTRVRAKYSRELPVAWTEVARFTAERGGGTLKINGARGQRGRSRWFDVPTVFTRKQTRECCHFEIFPKILNVHISLAEYAPNGALLDSTRSIISLSLFFISLETLFLQFEKNVTRQIARFPSPFFPRLKVENDGVDGAARGIPRFRGVTRCILAVARRRNRGGAQQRRPRWNVLTHNEIVLFHGFQGAVGLFRFSPCSKHVPYPRISVYPVFENSPSTCHHPTNFIHFSKTEKFLLFLSSFFPPPRFVKIRLAINDVIRIIVKFLPIFLSNKWILNNRGREKKRRKSERVSKRDIQVW